MACARVRLVEDASYLGEDPSELDKLPDERGEIPVADPIPASGDAPAKG